MKVLIIEDENHAARLLRESVSRARPKTQFVDELDSVKSSLNWFESNQEALDLIFMDIELADGNSFEIFKHTQVPAPVIFTTAYDRYALDAFKVNALDYLLKPIESIELERALTRWEEQDIPKLTVMQQRIEEMAATFQTKKKHRCLVKKGGVFEFISVCDIALAYSEESITFLITMEGKRHIYSNTIEQLYSEIDQTQFYQVNRAQLVNIDNILQVHPYLSQRLKLQLKVMEGVPEVLVSRQRAADFKSWLDS